MKNTEIEIILRNFPNFLGCFPKNSLPCDMKKKSKKGNSIIINDDKHWIALYLTEKEVLYFNSLGSKYMSKTSRQVRTRRDLITVDKEYVDKKILEFLNMYYDKVNFSIIANNLQIQPLGTLNCALYCIAFVKHVMQFDRFLDFIRKFTPISDYDEKKQIIASLHNDKVLSDLLLFDYVRR